MAGGAQGGKVDLWRTIRALTQGEEWFDVLIFGQDVLLGMNRWPQLFGPNKYHKYINEHVWSCFRIPHLRSLSNYIPCSPWSERQG